ncbi:hypothetical protein [Streptomyces narbonensis]
MSCSYSSWAATARSAASSRAAASRSISAWAAAARERAAFTWPWRRARPSRRSAMARAASLRRRSSAVSARSSSARWATVSSRARSAASRAASSSASCSRTRAASRSRSSGVAAAPLLGGRVGGALHARVGEGDRAADAFGELEQGVPALLGAFEAGGEGLDLGFERRFVAGERVAQLGPGGLLAGEEDRLVGDFGGERPLEPVQVVGEEPEAGVAQVGLDDEIARRATAACRPRGLSWRRSSSARSCTRARLACIASSFRSAFSLRLRCLRTPASP